MKNPLKIVSSKTVGISGYCFDKLMRTYPGYQPKKRKWYQWFKEETLPSDYYESLSLVEKFAEKLIIKKYDIFLCGMNDGFGLMAAQAIVNLKVKYANVKLVLVIPYEDFTMKHQWKIKREVLKNAT